MGVQYRRRRDTCPAAGRGCRRGRARPGPGWPRPCGSPAASGRSCGAGTGAAGPSRGRGWTRGRRILPRASWRSHVWGAGVTACFQPCSPPGPPAALTPLPELQSIWAPPRPLPGSPLQHGPAARGGHFPFPGPVAQLLRPPGLPACRDGTQASGTPALPPSYPPLPPGVQDPGPDTALPPQALGRYPRRPAPPRPHCLRGWDPDVRHPTASGERSQCLGPRPCPPRDHPTPVQRQEGSQVSGAGRRCLGAQGEVQIPLPAPAPPF